jgi:hypothetical protein
MIPCIFNSITMVIMVYWVFSLPFTPVGRNDSRVPSFRINHDSVYFLFYYIRKAAFSLPFTGFLVYHSRRPVVIRSRICIFNSVMIRIIEFRLLGLIMIPCIFNSIVFG